MTYQSSGEEQDAADDGVGQLARQAQLVVGQEEPQEDEPAMKPRMPTMVTTGMPPMRVRRSPVTTS